MQSLTCLFIVQGEGRGHLTQALALRGFLQRAGHHVCGAVVSRGGDAEIPAYFADHFQAPLRFVESAHLVVDGSTRSIQWLRTLAYNNRCWSRFRNSFAVIQEEIDRHQPDIIINFYEPLGGLYMMRYKPDIPTVAIAHQYMFLHPRYAFPNGFQMQRHGATLFTRLTAARTTRRFALSLYDAPKIASERLTVMPPLLRDELLTQSLGQQEPYFLIYLFHHSLSDSVVRWHRKHPGIALHCFWNNTDACEIEVVDDTLTFHRLHGLRFLEMMAKSRGVITTAGFESMAEALYLGKPLMLIPLNKHFEQHCNGIDGRNTGGAIQSDNFDLDRLIRFLPEYQYDPAPLRDWIARAEEFFVAEIESAVEQARSVLIRRAIA